MEPRPDSPVNLSFWSLLSDDSAPELVVDDQTESVSSLDDDYQYQTSTAELWDSFWSGQIRFPDEEDYLEEERQQQEEQNRHNDVASRCSTRDDDDTVTFPLRGRQSTTPIPRSPRPSRIPSKEDTKADTIRFWREGQQPWDIQDDLHQEQDRPSTSCLRSGYANTSYSLFPRPLEIPQRVTSLFPCPPTGRVVSKGAPIRNSASVSTLHTNPPEFRVSPPTSPNNTAATGRKSHGRKTAPEPLPFKHTLQDRPATSYHGPTTRPSIDLDHSLSPKSKSKSKSRSRPPPLPTRVTQHIPTSPTIATSTSSSTASSYYCNSSATSSTTVSPTASACNLPSWLNRPLPPIPTFYQQDSQPSSFFEDSDDEEDQPPPRMATRFNIVWKLHGPGHKRTNATSEKRHTKGSEMAAEHLKRARASLERDAPAAAVVAAPGTAESTRTATPTPAPTPEAKGHHRMRDMWARLFRVSRPW